jgi:cyclophilin family peptidyl-prolyl cis-trans isomerase
MASKMPHRRSSTADSTVAGSSTCSNSSLIDTMPHQHSPLRVHPISEDDDEMSNSVDEYGGGQSQQHCFGNHDHGESSSSNSSSGCSPPLEKQSISMGTIKASLYNLPKILFQSSDDGTSSQRHIDDMTCPYGSAPSEPLSPSCSSRSNTNQYCTALVFTARRRQNPLLFATMTAFAFMGVFLYTKSYSTLHNALDQVTILTHERRQVHRHFQTVEDDIHQLQRQLLELDQSAGVYSLIRSGDRTRGSSSISSSGTDTTLASSKADTSIREGDDESLETSENNGGDNGNYLKEDAMLGEMVTLQEKLREGSSHIGNLQKHIQAMSRRDALQKYGAGVIRVQFELEFPKDNGSSGIGGPTAITLEMAPIDLMPHSVYMFLEMVHAGLFDGCSFILNAMHVIKAAPLPYDGSSASQKVKAFTKRGLETVAFREYSPDYPHEQFTIGFAADGSPSFYINTQDNSEIHVGEPCFARIVSGFDTVKRLEEVPTRNGIFYRRRIGLKTASIL